jgi:hypothetical protein
MVHIHALVYGEYLPQRLLENAWGDAVRERARVDVRAVKSEKGIAGALREVLKYATKGEKGQRTQAERAAAVESAFRNVHRIALGGAIRKIRIADSSGSSEDVRTTDLHELRVMSCEECGVVGEWKWVGIVDEGIVQENGGFGLLRLLSHPSLGESG